MATEIARFDNNRMHLDKDGEADHITVKIETTDNPNEVKVTTFTALSSESFQHSRQQSAIRNITSSTGQALRWSLSGDKVSNAWLMVANGKTTPQEDVDALWNLLPDEDRERINQDRDQAGDKEFDKEIAENAGVLGALRDDSALDSVLGSTGLNADKMNGIGGLIGNKGTQIGSGGLGARGSGLGGGGKAEGLGGLGTKGRGTGASGYGTGGGNFGSKGEGGIGTVGGDPLILGALDRSLIDAVIKRNMSQIRYCYQKGLEKDPTLGGRVVMKIVIAKDGTVSSATIKSSTLPAGEAKDIVEKLMCGRIMRYQFPEPKGGGIVITSYPFIFSPG